MAAVLAIACLLAAGATQASAAKRVVGKDGRIYACYKTAGKTSGAVRVVPKARKCRRGERKLNWSVAGPAGSQGAQGQSGSAGSAGSNGAAGSNGSSGASDVVKLESQLLSLSAEVDLLKGILDGVDNQALTKALATVDGITNTDLTGVLGKLNGITGTDLQEAVGAV
ncbi:MAG TPA: collagen-like protein, partial [Solirubrobacterales bacterium]|nr:collagen-like protein [Solirubrobacterales bacterium]